MKSTIVIRIEIDGQDGVTPYRAVQSLVYRIRQQARLSNFGFGNVITSIKAVLLDENGNVTHEIPTT